MNLILKSFDSPYLNLAYEEWLFEHFRGEVLRLWINPSSVIVGKHQNALAECNFHYCKENNIPVIRRISGGGTVYHDVGNINFSFFRPVDQNKLIDYERSLVLIKKALEKLGYPVHMNARHDLYLSEYKVSGNAQHLRKGKALHHGTILYDSDRIKLSSSISRKNGRFTDKSVASVRSKVTNLRTEQDVGDSNAFLQKLISALNELGVSTAAAPEPAEGELAYKLAQRYSIEGWNYGYSPAYTFENSIEKFDIKLEAQRGGEITGCEIRESDALLANLSNEMIGRKHLPSEIFSWLDESRALEKADVTILKRLIF